jgi:hypothetical protein
MKKQLNEVKRLQKIAGLLKESELKVESNGMGNKIKKLISKYPGKPVDQDYAQDFSPYTSNLKIHYFGGQDHNDIKSVIVGQDSETGETAYWEIMSDEEMDNPYGETSDPYGEPSGILRENNNSNGIESQLMSTIKGQSNDMSFLSGVSDQEFVAALEKLGVNYEVSDSGMSMDYYIGKPGNGIVFSNTDGDWYADDWQRP